jgi:hypothetical protein
MFDDGLFVTKRAAQIIERARARFKRSNRYDSKTSLISVFVVLET